MKKSTRLKHTVQHQMCNFWKVFHYTTFVCRYAYQLKDVKVVNSIHLFCPDLIFLLHRMFQKWSTKGRWETTACIWATSFVSNQWWAWSFWFTWFREKTGRTGFMLCLYWNKFFIIRDNSHKLIVFLQLTLLNIISSYHITNNKYIFVLVVLVYYDVTQCNRIMDVRIFLNHQTHWSTWYGKYFFFKLTLLLIWYFYWPSWGIYNRSYQRVYNRQLDGEKTRILSVFVIIVIAIGTIS